MKTFKNFLLLESNDYIKNIQFDDAIKLVKLSPMFDTIMKQDDINTNNLFLRIVSKGYKNGDELESNIYTNYTVIDPQNITRVSPNTSYNAYNLLLSNLPSWDKFPKRDNSLIGGDIESIMQRKHSVENVMVVIPFGGDVGVCSKRDIWLSFNKSIGKDINWFINQHFMEYIDQVMDFQNQPDRDMEVFKKLLEDFDNKRNPHEDRNIFAATQTRDTILDKELGKKWYDKEISSFDMLNTLLNPYKNGFTIIEDYDASKKLPTEKELWCDSKSLLIRYDEIDDFFKAVREYYK